MKRRDFLHASGVAGLGALAASAVGADDAPAPAAAANDRQFKLHYAPHFGTFRNVAGPDLVDQIKFAADQGFTAWEDNGMKNRSVEDQERIAKTLSDLGMKMGVFVAHSDAGKVTFAGRDKNLRAQVVQEIKDSVDVAKRVGAKWMTVVPDAYSDRVEWGYQTANCVELLRECAAVLEPHELVMVLEPLNWWTNHPGLFLHKVPQAYEICRAVNSPSCKILFDIYHQQIQEGNLIPNLDAAWSEVAYIQTGDNPGRKEPGTGEINYLNIFKHLHEKGFEGVIGMEHGNSIAGADGDRAVIEAYRKADAF
ncbi:Hydroxypyruvate isomerase [Pirellulimonas nuda]|uniref:Hydroxypyruvate isomerase n=1 Tax=Pirellulimonas nuda TaxID=2528009 RepID=A0A518DH38_9BACT|nr:TIM barrel protein [Pirellulimonas nuda]QDU90784.1 Hydroxypyruvate isomerase [Pirellulimonas nuda]